MGKRSECLIFFSFSLLFACLMAACLRFFFGARRGGRKVIAFVVDEVFVEKIEFKSLGSLFFFYNDIFKSEKLFRAIVLLISEIIIPYGLIF